MFEPTGKDLPRLVNPFLGAICRSAIDIFVAKYISAKTHTILPINVHMEDEYFEEEWGQRADFVQGSYKYMNIDIYKYI